MRVRISGQAERGRALTIAMRLTTGLLLPAFAAHAQFLLPPDKPPVDVPVDTVQPPLRALDGVTVYGKKNPLDEADEKLRRLKQKNPGLGTEEERDRDRLEKLADWYKALPRDPNKLNPESQVFLDRVVNENDSNINHRAATPDLPRRDGADYIDPISATQKK